MQRQFVTDAEAQPLIAAASNNFNESFFYQNNSKLPLDEVQYHFCSLFPSVTAQRQNPKILCGYKDNREMRPIEQAVRMRKINLRAVPWGKQQNEPWNLSYLELPPMMGFDVDENDKPSFKKLYPEYHCYEIHDALDIPRPLVITINPISMNCQYIYEMAWTPEDHKDPEAARAEYEKVRKELSRLFGADPNFVNHVVRSPLFIAGHHRKNPNRRASERKINVEKESLWHYSQWYDPHAYTLAELKEIIVYLRDLFGVPVENVPAIVVEQKKQKYIPKTENTRNSLPLSEQQQLASIPANQVQEGSRNNWLFANIAMFCRPLAPKYRGAQRASAGTFMNEALAKARELNNQLSYPLSPDEVLRTTRSVFNWCLSPRFTPMGRTSEEATHINIHFRWGTDYVTNAQKAKALGISLRTYYRRQQQDGCSSSKPSASFPLKHQFQTVQLTILHHDRDYAKSDTKGRPRVYQSNAAKCQAYRLRKKQQEKPRAAKQRQENVTIKERDNEVNKTQLKKMTFQELRTAIFLKWHDAVREGNLSLMKALLPLRNAAVKPEVEMFDD